MLVKELVCNRDFDMDCSFEVYDCTKRGTDWNNGGIKVFSTVDDGEVEPSDDVLKMNVLYLTICQEGNMVIIEAGRERCV